MEVANRHRRRRMLALAALALAVPWPAGASLNLEIPQAAPLSHSQPDELTAPPGPYMVVRTEYDFGYVLVTDSTTGLPNVAGLRGVLHYPATGAGPFPLVLFLHGNHATCILAGHDSIFVPGASLCRYLDPVAEPLANAAGYDYLAAPLASEGYVVASVDAGDVNDRQHLGPSGTGDFGIGARAQLLLDTIDVFARVNDGKWPGPPTEALTGRIDLGRIGLMGHSRGGEAVVKALEDNQAKGSTPRAIRAVFSLAPTDFLQLAAPNVPFATLLPYCDGDVSNLWGASIYDDSRYLNESVPSPKVQLLVMGANHNNFNTAWTADDADLLGPDPYCDLSLPGNGRLEPEAQRALAQDYVNGFFRLHLGGETGFDALFVESRTHSGACPAGPGTCAGDVHVSHHPPAGGRLLVEDGRGGQVLATNDLGGAVHLGGALTQSSCESAECPVQPNSGHARQITLQWTGAGVYRSEVPASAGDLRPFEALTFRAGIDFELRRSPSEDPGQLVASQGAPSFSRTFNQGIEGLEVGLVDAQGQTAWTPVADHSRALFEPPGHLNPACPEPPNCPEPGALRVTLNMVRIPLSAFVGVDLGAVREIRLRAGDDAAVRLQFTDLMFQA